MFVNLSDLHNRDVEFRLESQPGQLGVLDEQVRQETKMMASGLVRYRASTREIFVQGSLEVTVSFPCDRCLTQILRPIHLALDLSYLPEDASPTEEEREVTADEVDLAFYKGSGIDLLDVLREQILLDLPMRRVCEPGCASVANPDVIQLVASPDPRWSALEGFRPKTGKPSV